MEDWLECGLEYVLDDRMVDLRELEDGLEKGLTKGRV
jgi:hypothetical protein